MKEKCLLFITNYTAWVAEKIEYSLSGYKYEIRREGFKNYKPVISNESSGSNYTRIRRDMNNHQYFSVFQNMLDNKIGDCAEQSLLLAIILKKLKTVNENYVIFQTHTEDCNVNHTFLTLIPRNSSFLQENKDFNEMMVEKKGSLLQENKDILVIDPWRNIIFDGTIDSSNNPLNFAPSVSFKDTDFIFQNLDCVYLKLQNEFIAFYKKILIKELLINLPQDADKNTQTLKETILSGDYNLALRRACSNQKYINVVKLLLQNQELLDIDIFAKGKTSGDALQIATNNKNDKAIEIIRPYLNLNSKSIKNEILEGKENLSIAPRW